MSPINPMNYPTDYDTSVDPAGTSMDEGVFLYWKVYDKDNNLLAEYGTWPVYYDIRDAQYAWVQDTYYHQFTAVDKDKCPIRVEWHVEDYGFHDGSILQGDDPDRSGSFRIWVRDTIPPKLEGFFAPGDPIDAAGYMTTCQGLCETVKSLPSTFDYVDVPVGASAELRIRSEDSINIAPTDHDTWSDPFIITDEAVFLYWKIYDRYNNLIAEYGTWPIYYDLRDASRSWVQGVYTYNFTAEDAARSPLRVEWHVDDYGYYGAVQRTSNDPNRTGTYFVNVRSSEPEAPLEAEWSPGCPIDAAGYLKPCLTFCETIKSFNGTSTDLFIPTDEAIQLSIMSEDSIDIDPSDYDNWSDPFGYDMDEAVFLYWKIYDKNNNLVADYGTWPVYFDMRDAPNAWVQGVYTHQFTASDAVSSPFRVEWHVDDYGYHAGMALRGDDQNFSGTYRIHLQTTEPEPPMEAEWSPGCPIDAAGYLTACRSICDTIKTLDGEIETVFVQANETVDLSIKSEDSIDIDPSDYDVWSDPFGYDMDEAVFLYWKIYDKDNNLVADYGTWPIYFDIRDASNAWVQGVYSHFFSADDITKSPFRVEWHVDDYGYHAGMALRGDDPNLSGTFRIYVLSSEPVPPLESEWSPGCPIDAAGYMESPVFKDPVQSLDGTSVQVSLPVGEAVELSIKSEDSIYVDPSDFDTWCDPYGYDMDEAVFLYWKIYDKDNNLLADYGTWPIYFDDRDAPNVWVQGVYIHPFTVDDVARSPIRVEWHVDDYGYHNGLALRGDDPNVSGCYYITFN